MRMPHRIACLLPVCCLCLLMCALPALSQTGSPDDPGGPGPRWVTPAPPDSTLAPLSVILGVSGSLRLTLLYPAGLFLSVVPSSPALRPPVLREPRDRGRQSARTAGGRFVKR